MAFSLDGNTLASGGYYNDNTVRLWDVETGINTHTLTGHESPVSRVSFSPYGNTLVSASYDGTVRLWDVDTGTHTRTLTGQEKGAISRAVLSRDRNTLATVSWRGIRLWDVDTGKNTHTLTPTGYSNGEIQSMAFSPDGNTLATASWARRLQVWDVKTGKNIHTRTGYMLGVRCVAFSPDGNTIVSGGNDQRVRLWDLETSANTLSFVGMGVDGISEHVSSVAFNPDGNTFASGGENGTVQLWDVDRLYQLYLEGSGENGTVELWVSDTGANILTLTGHEEEVSSVAFSWDENTLASGDDAGTVRLWDVDTGTNTLTLAGHTERVWSVAFSRDGNTLASASGSRRVPFSESSDKTVRLWDVNTGTNTDTFTGDAEWVHIVALSPDGNTLATVNWQGIRLWDVDTDTNTITITGNFTGLTGHINGVAFSPDGNTLATVSWREIRLWDVDTGANLHTFTGHTSSIESVTFSPDGNTLASGSSDGIILLWALTPFASTPGVNGDVNGDGLVNLLDVVLVGAQIGQTGPNDADVNGDGVVNVVDMVLVAAEFVDLAAAPAAHPHLLAQFTPADVQGWLTQARQMGLTTPTYLRGIAVLEQLLAALTPKETALLSNYPNPFNPETWIPYRLAEAADVQITIYDTKGAIVRQLALGHHAPGFYTTRAKAAYWDGRNENGEAVASGIYFYQLRAGDYTATKRMLILK